jgi:tellurite resistance protein TehA-like permease
LDKSATWSLSNLYPGYFALVMATGILSVVGFLVHWTDLSDALFIIASVFYLWLIVLYIARIFRFPAQVKADMFNPLRVFGYFTFVAGTDILATRLGLSGYLWPVLILGCIGFLVWCGLLYFIFAMLVFHNERAVHESVNGAWLIATVGTESLSIVAAILAVHLHFMSEALLFVAYAFWSFGILLYLIFIVIIMYRFFFKAVHPADLSPPYWINMGAMAITTVAGVRLANPGAATKFLAAVHPFVVAFTVTMWTWGTWWIPLLVIMGIWKYRMYKRIEPFDPSLWSIIFPLGMYSAALALMSSFPGLHFLHYAVKYFYIIALVCWCLVLVDWFAHDVLKVRSQETK